ncbi:hypothetical protein EIP91_010058 [Steccherinum ochraceum]|uniref:Uncharacterized protein n=1 Tax=Steccherinum ochraceum TaxID=92696 RepID=A0A4R0R0X4_9APHY|nr:hypothetical protein EIP91_010058 [Steccherinum ochraceum]
MLAALSKPAVLCRFVTASRLGATQIHGGTKRHLQAQGPRRKQHAGQSHFDASRLDYDDDQMINTTMPMRFSPTGELLGYPPNVDTDGESERYISGHLKRKLALTPGIGAPLPHVEGKTYRIEDVPGKSVGMLAERNIAAASPSSQNGPC